MHAINFSSQEAETGRTLSSRPVWATERVLGQPGLHSVSEIPIINYKERKRRRKNPQTLA